MILSLKFVQINRTAKFRVDYGIQEINTKDNVNEQKK